MITIMTLRRLLLRAKAMQGLLSDGVGKNADIHIIVSDAYDCGRRNA
jgi:hypothetical protein